MEAKPQRRNPQPPFTTSTLQQEAQRKLGFDASRTMQIAQRLYEGVEIGGEPVGLITYMRTDGVDIAPEALSETRRMIEREYGARYMPDAPRRYHAKAKNAQEAHEAIRPTDLARLPADVERFLDRDQARLYELIWKRTVASQMAAAELERTTIDIDARSAEGDARLRATGSVIRFDGFLTLYQEGRDDAEDEEGGRLPQMAARRTPGAREDRRRPAFHRAAAALHRGFAHQADGRARHRPAVDLRRDDGGAPQAQLRARREEAASCRRITAGSSPPSWKASSAATSNTTSPPTWRRSSTASRPASSPGRMCCAISGSDFSATVAQTTEIKRSDVLEALNDHPRATISFRSGRTAAIPARVPPAAPAGCR